jgi:hypothetical protein
LLFTFYSCLDALSFAFYILLCFFLFDGQTVMVCALQARWPLSCCLRSRQASPDWHSTYGPSPDVQCRCAHSIRGLTVTRRAHPAPGGAAPLPLDPPYRLRLMLPAPALMMLQPTRHGREGGGARLAASASGNHDPASRLRLSLVLGQGAPHISTIYERGTLSS